MQCQSIYNDEKGPEEVYVYIGPDELITQWKYPFLVTMVKRSTKIYDGAAVAFLSR